MSDIYKYQNISGIITVNEEALDGVAEAVVTVHQGNHLFHYIFSDGSLDIDLANKQLAFFMSQEDTALFKHDMPVSVQVNITNTDGDRLTSDEVMATDENGDIILVKANLYKEVM